MEKFFDSRATVEAQLDEQYRESADASARLVASAIIWTGMRICEELGKLGDRVEPPAQPL